MYLLFILFFAGISGFSGICFPKRDFVFLLDESGSVGSTRFQTMKRFVSEFMEHFTIGPTANQFSVVVFNDVAREVFSLNRHFSLSDIQSAVMNIAHSSGGTSIGKGLEYARLFSFALSRGARSDSAKIVILITDGQSSISNDAQLLKDQNVTIFCIGLIKNIDEQLLRDVSTNNDYTNITDMFTTLSRIQAHAVEKSCADHEGNYTCIVSNLYSSDSADVSLDIVSFDVVDETTVSLVFGDFRANVTLICNVASLYSPVSSVTWERDGTRIDPQSHDRYRGGSVTTPSLFIINLNTTDQGNYSCSASNMFGSGQSYIYLMITIGSSEDPCDSCGIFYDCVLSSDVCSKSAWKVAMFSLLTLFACLLLLGAMLLCMIQKYKSRRSFVVDKKSQQWEFEVQLLSFKM